MTNDLDRLDERMAAAGGQLLQSLLRAAQARSSAEDAERLGNLTRAQLVIEARGDDLQVSLLAPTSDGRTVVLYQFSATSAGAAGAAH